MKILIAPDKFKGSLSAKKVCEAITSGLKSVHKNVAITQHPMADGGDDSLVILSDHLSLEKISVQTQNPLGKSIVADYYTSKNTAFIEVASASGIVLLNPSERNPLKTSTFGTGLLVKDAIEKGFQKIYIFLGGSATNDAGIGIAYALGFDFLDQKNNVLEPIGENLIHIHQIIDRSDIDFDKIQITLFCDVTNPLFGKNGAAYVYAAQKGATSRQIEYLDAGLQHFSTVIFQKTGIKVSNIAGTGAAGGIGASLVALCQAKISKGFEAVARLTHLEEHIRQSDIVISGEGRLDEQSLQGKVIFGIADLCQKYNKKLILLVGKNDLNPHITLPKSIRQVLEIMEIAVNDTDAIKNAAYYLQKQSEKINLILPDD